MGCDLTCELSYAFGMYYVRDHKLRSQQNIIIYPNFNNAKWGLDSVVEIATNIASVKEALQYSPVITRFFLPDDHSWGIGRGT